MLKPSIAGKLGLPHCCHYQSLEDHSGTEHSGRYKNSNGIILCSVVVLGVSLLALCCVGIPLIVYILSAVRVMEARLGSLEKELAVITSKYEMLLLQQQQQQQKLQKPTFLHETPTPTQIPNVLKRRKRNTTRHATTNFIHLIGKGSSDSTTQVGDTIIFKWQKREHRRAEGFTLLPNAQDTSSIKILNSGVYLVYSQVAVHGRSNNNVQFYCSHNMQLKKGQNGPTSNILSSLLTQDNRGLEYLNMSVNGLKPLDTQLHMGVFFLLPEDELSVRIPPSCASTNYSTVAENSYFGVVKIG